ncbi:MULTISPECIES: acyl-CoA thioesterase [Acinetobacter]|uniref:acyl-CoA thioesterase n=1 Tax=Acinetobacter TaxID=469 RepID=UPI0015D13A04|nr:MULTISPECIES: thioesterase family protein [Acinetobacter]WQJ00517.1 thioesterase family protein [Acinetobacter schindleri]
MSKAPVKTREQYTFFLSIQTRWADNDLYGHVNNVTYYSYFDTAANALLIQHAGFDPRTSPNIGLVVNSCCQFNQELSYPEVIEVGVNIAKLGGSSLTYDLAIFKQGNDQAAAQGSFVHVFVDRHTRKSTPISNKMRDALCPFMHNSCEI